MAISSVTSRSVAIVPSDGARSLIPTPPTAPDTVAQKPTADAPSQPPPPEQVAKAVKKVNDVFSEKGQNLYASIERDKTTGINIVKVLDKNTREVVSQFPSKEVIALADAMSQSQEGKGQLIHVSA